MQITTTLTNTIIIIITIIKCNTVTLTSNNQPHRFRHTTAMYNSEVAMVGIVGPMVRATTGGAPARTRPMGTKMAPHFRILWVEI